MSSEALSPSGLPEGLNFIEQLTALATGNCKAPGAPVLIGVDHNHEQAGFFRAGCKRWSCSECGARNGKTWLAKIINGCNVIGGKWQFVTLTAHRKWRGVSSIENIKKNWSKLRKRMARWMTDNQSGVDPAYVWVYERHADWSWHVHMLTNCEAQTKWWKDNSAECGMGHQCKSISLDNIGQAAGYVAKYLLKSVTEVISWPEGLRRVTTSRNWPKLEKKVSDDGIDWIVALDKNQVQYHSEKFRRWGWEVKGDKAVMRLMDKYSGEM